MLNKLLFISSLSLFLVLFFAYTEQAIFYHSLHASEDAPFITDDEEYAVWAAVLFHNAPEAAVNSTEPKQKDSSYRYNTSLDGIPADFFNLSRRTTVRSLPDKGLDRTIVDDFNRNNSTEYQIDPDKFAAVAPKGNRVALITPKRFSVYDDPSKTKSIWFGTTYISRPGFNKARTVAVLQVSHVANPEMGIGYQVTLKKSPQDGTWSIVDAIINRMY
jgi:hypothetical protein